MAGIARWYSKWEGLEVDSDGEELQAVPELDEATREVLKRFPPDIRESIAREPSRCKREALLALNCYICELQGPARQAPTVQKQLLAAVCEALRGLEEGGEVETLLFRVSDALCNPVVNPMQVEHAVGAIASLQPVLRDERVVEVIVRAAIRRLKEFSARCLAHVCWSSATLGKSDASWALLQEAMPLAEKLSRQFEATDIALFAWACATSCPPGARSALTTMVSDARLPSPDSSDGRVVAWALEYVGIDAVPFFGPPPTAVPQDIAMSLHRRMDDLSRRDDIEVVYLDSNRPMILSIDSLVAPEEADALLKLAETRWQPSRNFAGLPSDTSLPTWGVPEVAVMETTASASAPILQRLRRRAASLLQLPESHCELPQMTRHLYSTRSEARTDVFSTDSASRGLLYLGGQRVVSIMVCLSKVGSGHGGETVFPRLGNEGHRVPTSCGQALLWLNIRPRGDLEDRLSYMSAPLNDEKATKVYLHLWLRAHPVMEGESSHHCSDDVGTEVSRMNIKVEERGGPTIGKEDSDRSSKVQAVSLAFQANSASPAASAVATAQSGSKMPGGANECDELVFEVVD